MAKIYKLVIKNFRGIKEFSYTFGDFDLICLVGRGDTGKSTILKAISYVLYPSWNPTFYDTDFYNCETDSPIEIETTLINIPEALLKEDKYGLYIRGVNKETKEIEDELRDEHEKALTIKLEIKKDLEPKWYVVNNRQDSPVSISAYDRAKLNTFIISDYLDAHFHWRRGAPLYSLLKQIDILDYEDDTILVEAVREGRIIFENLKKPINYLLTCNFGEVAAVFGGELLGLPPVFRPIHLLWINVVTDSLPAVALGLEPPEPGIMERPPRKKHERFVTPRKLAYYTITGVILAFITLYMFLSVFKPGDITSLIFAQTLAFTTIVLSEFGRAFASRSENVPIWRLENNIWLWIALFISLLLQLIILYVPYLQVPFGVIPIPLYYYPLLIILSLVILVVDEIRKALKIKI